MMGLCVVICVVKIILSIYVARPVFKAISLNYTAFIGSHITFACEIIYFGNPKVVFYWITPQEESVSNDLVHTNSTHTTLLVNNLTEQDSGRYACIADAKLYQYGKQMFLYLQGLFHYGEHFTTISSLHLPYPVVKTNQPPIQA